MNLPPPPDKYDPAWMARLMQELEDEMAMRLRIDGTLEIRADATRAEITDDVTGDRYLVGVSAGAISLTPL